ncbi:MAG: RidA family protein [Spirillospora sp.]
MKKHLDSITFDSAEHGRAGAVAAGGLVFTDATALDLGTLRRVPEATTIAAETRVCLDRLARTLEQAGCTLRDVVKVNSYLTDDADRAEFWATYNEIMAPGPYPVRLTQVGGLDGDARVMLDVVAVHPS